MPLQDVELSFDEVEPLTEAARELIEDAEERIARFIRGRAERDPIAAFVACDFHMAGRALVTLAGARLAPGETFCEWGAGFAVVAGLAELAGFDACGIEVHRDLVDEARALLEDHGLSAEVAHGSLIPDDGDALVDELAQQAWLRTGEASGYDELGLDAEDFDVVFAYPWPGDEELIDKLFEKYAAVGALLLTYHGMNDLRLQRKT